jgi:hypothetical protein
MIIVEQEDRVLRTFEPSHEQMTAYLNSIGIPPSVWLGNFTDLMKDLAPSRDIKFKRSVKTPVDISTELEIVHDAHYLTDPQGDKAVYQELILNIDHQRSGRTDGVYFPGSSAYRNMLKFIRTEVASESTGTNEVWKYLGTYSGKLMTGELPNELTQDNPALGIPNGKVLDKALTVLSERPF